MENKDIKFDNIDELITHILVCITQYAEYHKFDWPENATRCTSDYEQNMHLVMTRMPGVVYEIMIRIPDHSDHVMNRVFTKQRVNTFTQVLSELCDKWYAEAIKEMD